MIMHYAKGREKNHLYCVICIFRAKMRYVILRGMTKSLISGRMDVGNSISTLLQSYFRFYCIKHFIPSFGVSAYPFFNPYRFSMLQFLNVPFCHVSFLS